MRSFSYLDSVSNLAFFYSSLSLFNFRLSLSSITSSMSDFYFVIAFCILVFCSVASLWLSSSLAFSAASISVNSFLIYSMMRSLSLFNPVSWCCRFATVLANKDSYSLYMVRFWSLPLS